MACENCEVARAKLIDLGNELHRERHRAQALSARFADVSEIAGEYKQLVQLAGKLAGAARDVTGGVGLWGECIPPMALIDAPAKIAALRTALDAYDRRVLELDLGSPE